jgi:hypothetical protein
MEWKFRRYRVWEAGTIMLRFNETCGMKEKKRYQGFHFVACFGGVKLEFGFDFLFSLWVLWGML